MVIPDLGFPEICFCHFFDHLKIKSFLARSETSADVNDSSELSFRPAGLRSQAGWRQAGGRLEGDHLRICYCLMFRGDGNVP